MQSKSIPATPKLLLTAREAAVSLSVCEKTLWSHTEPRGTIPCVRIGARCLYDPRDLAAWIDARKKGSADR
jgi:hypothetical protein